ncbi:MAG TPA: adenosylcobinamide-GDP ribazoletransferase [Aggregatilineaceae bacterium]|nr:adenosylcobinamide-GDP ribazoletransferase [Aggregatilineaceae bacterium]
MFDGLLFAFTFLTVLPVGKLPLGNRLARSVDSPPGRMYSFFPLVGLVIGVIVCLTASLSFLPRDLAAFLALAAWVGLTGGLHLDGLADSCDGLLATVTPERRLEIMKDPRAGSWAVIGIVLVLLGKWVALRSVAPALLLIPPVLGRWSMVLTAAAFPSARSTGLAAQFRAGLGRSQVGIATAITLAIGIAVSLARGWPILLLVGIAPIMIWGGGSWAAKRLGGGLTGDVYGALCELVELVCLICLSFS